jgi:hypothetical protein
MSQSEKSGYFQALKAAGVTFDRHYREYTTAELKAAYDRLPSQPQLPTPPSDVVRTDADGLVPPAPGVVPEPAFDPAALAEAYAGLVQPEGPAVARPEPYPVFEEPAPPPLPVRAADPNEMAGARLNTKDADEPIRRDEHGRLWYQEEVRKPGYPKPRGRRVLTYTDTGTETRTLVTGKENNGSDVVETFEVAGTGPGRTAQVKITLPSYQVGIYRDPRFPFKVITYNGNEGFDREDVQNYYGGPELVPAEVKRKYVENVLCYDIRTVVRAINDEYRRLQLTGKVK